MNLKEAYQKKVQSQLDEWNLEIKKLQAKAREYEADTQIEYLNKLEELREQRDKLQEKVTKIESASENAWEDLKVGIEEAKEALKESFNSAKKRF